MSQVFIVTKPLQYVNCTNIEKNNDSICCVCNQFSNSYNFYEKCLSLDDFAKYIFFENKKSALLYWLFNQRKISQLYLDSDFGLLTRFLLLFFVNISVSLYEEGYASYYPLRRGDSLKNKILLFIQKMFGIKNYNGGSCKVKSFYLYNAKRYSETFSETGLKLLKFKNPFFDAVANAKVLEKLSMDVDYDLFNNKIVLIYLSSWSISKKAVEYCIDLKDDVDLRVLKLHPNIKSTPAWVKDSFDYNLPSNIMFEYFFVKIRNIVKKLIIVHHNSFAVEYIDENDKIVFVPFETK